jgi:hypothetical protein
MSFLFTSPPPSYAEEQLSSHLSTLSTLPVTLEPSLRAAAAPPPALQSALHELSSTKAIPREKLVEVLKSLSKESVGAYRADEGIKVLENEVISRAATMVWKEVLDAFVRGALELEEERNWWEAVVNSHRGVVIYLIQSESGVHRGSLFRSSFSSPAPTVQVDSTTQLIQPGFTPVIPLPIPLSTVQAPPQRFCRAHVPDVPIQPHAPGDTLLSQVPHSHEGQFRASDRTARFSRTQVDGGED